MRISWLGQVRIYVGKCFRTFANERGWKILISSAIIALIVAWVSGSEMFITYRATRSGAFALISACIWMGIFNSIQSICRERAIIKREYRTGLYLSSYISAHMIYQMALCLAQAFITATIVFIFRSPPSAGIFMPAYFEMLITFFVVIFAADVLGLLVSSIAKTENAAMTAMPFVLILQLVMSGVVFELEGLASVLSVFTVSRWGVNAICSIANVARMPDARFVENFNPNNYTHTSGHLAQIWFILMVFAVLYGVFALVSLKFIDKDKR